MRTRNQSKRPHQSTGEKEALEHHRESENIDDNETLANVSRDAVGRLLKRVKRGFNKEDISYLRRCDSVAKPEREQKGNDDESTGTAVSIDTKDTESCSRDAIDNAPSEVKVEEGRSQYSKPIKEDEFDDPDWEDGSIPASHSTENNREELINGMTVEFDVSPGSAKQKAVRRVTAQEKEVAELVHKAHLLCLLGRGRLIDSACNDTLIQASLLSLLPPDLLKIAEIPKLTATCLTPIVCWFHHNFHVRSPSGAEKSCRLTLASTLETREGTSEEVAALSVALFRALNLTTRFVSILDVASLKPDAEKYASTNNDVSKGGKGIFNSSTLMVAGPSGSFASPLKSSSFDDMQKGSQTPVRGSGETMTDKSMKREFQSHGNFVTDRSTDGKSDQLFTEAAASVPYLMESEGLKRKGDLEFEMQLKIALSATAIGSSKHTMAPSVVDSPSNSSTNAPPCKIMKNIMTEGSPSSSNGISTSIGSKKVGAPLYWAEVFCSGDNLTGKWVHVDAVNAIIDGEQKVEAAAAACKKSLRYVVAFAGRGAKDVTRRYCTKWYKIASQRINSTWWDSVLAPLKELESGATSGVINLQQEASVGEIKALQGADHPGQECLLKTKQQLCGASEDCGEKAVVSSVKKNSVEATRSSLEDMELETRALTEPLPTNQQAYKNHHLYALERWLKKYEIMYPKGPVLGFCSGLPVYPRTCVQTVHTKERWLREGLQVKDDELPAKVLKRALNRSKEKSHEDDEYSEVNREGTVSLYGKWQTEKLCLPRAINGIVPKNERGRVDVWSEKCLPPGTVHLRLPRVGLVAKKLDIDYAPAMVGFEFRNGSSFPVVEGIVVCAEFKDAILEAYAEEEERRKAEEKRRNEAQALSRWYQLLSSIITRQRLNNCYGDGDSSQPSIDIPIRDNKSSTPSSCTTQKNVSPGCHQVNTLDGKHESLSTIPRQNHEHEFIVDDQTFNQESSLRVKKCWCGFSIEFEEF